MQPFVAGQGHIQVDAFEPQVATVGGVAEKQLRGGCRKRLGERRCTGRFALEPSILRRSLLFAGAPFDFSPEALTRLGLLQKFLLKTILAAAPPHTRPRSGGEDDGMRPKPVPFSPGHHRSFTSQ